MGREALVIVDIQNDFCPGGALPVIDGDQVVKLINRLSGHAKIKGWEIFASRDWHPKGSEHFNLWPVHCVQDTQGAQFHPDLELEGVTIITKGTGLRENAYSAFDGRDNMGRLFEEVLTERGVRKIFIAGLATDYCDKATAIDSAQKGFETHFIKDASKAVNLHPGDEKKAIKEMEVNGVKVVELDRVLNE